MHSKRIKLVELNVTELCSRKCWFCPRYDSSVYPNKNEHMSKETFDRIKYSLIESEYSGSICISGFSEPLMCKNIMYGLSVLSSFWKTTLITNFDFLNSEKLKLLDEFNLEELKIDLYDGEWQLEKLEKMLKDYNYKNQMLVKKVYSNKELNFYNRGGTSKFESKFGINPNRPCHIPFYKAMIDWNGDYILCHSDWHRESEISKSKMNVYTHTLEQYLKSEVYTNFAISMIKTKRCGLKPCEKCDIYGLSEGYIWNPKE